MTITTNTLISKITVGKGGVASVTFDAIPQTYTDLKIIISARGERNTYADDFKVTVNNNNSATYSVRRMYGSGSSVGGDGGSSTGNANSYSGVLNGNTAYADSFGSSEFYFFNYSVNGVTKTWSADGVSETNASAAQQDFTANLISDTNPITILKFESYNSGIIDEFSTFYIYGISSNTSTQNTTAPYALGGDVIATDGTYWYHAFKYSGSFTPLKNLSCDLLMIGGGGAGGSDSGGGGGAGVLTNPTSINFTSGTTFSCTVGAGGASSTFNGTSSSINSNSASYGTGGQGNFPDAGNGGNSGSYTGGAGNAGGANSRLGGGGAGCINNGGSYYSSHGGNGGDGTNTHSSLLSIVGLGVNGYIGGGGGAGVELTSYTVGSGGAGGGGQGGKSNGIPTGTAGTSNTGSGGGGGGGKAGVNSGVGGQGGSGFVIIKYAI